MLIDTRTLLAFVTVADESSFTGAAHRLHLAQPALTKQIQRLEKELDLPLFKRSKRSVRLTMHGLQLLGAARNALSSNEAVSIKAEQLRRGEAGCLRLGFTPTAAETILPPLLRRYRDHFPQVECTLVELSSADQLSAIENGSIDIGLLRPSGIPNKHVCFKQLIRESFFVLMPREHSLANRASVSLSALASEVFVMVSKAAAPLIHEQVVSACQATGFNPRIVHEATQMHAVAALVAGGCGVAVLPASVRHVRLKHLVYRPLRDRTLQSVLGLAWSSQHTATSIIDSFLKIAAELRLQTI